MFNASDEESQHNGVGSDADILAAVDKYLADREPRDILETLYHHPTSSVDPVLDTLTGLLPIEQIATAKLVDRLNRSGLPSRADPAGDAAEDRHR